MVMSPKAPQLVTWISLLLAAAVLKAGHPSEKDGCVILAEFVDAGTRTNGKNTENAKSTEIDPVKNSLWVLKHDSRLLPLARWLSSKIQVLSEAQLKDRLLANISRFVDGLKNGDRVVFVIHRKPDAVGAPPRSNNSNAWLTGVTKQKFPQLQDSPVIYHDDVLAMKKLITPTTKVVIVDDVSYSGVQIRTTAGFIGVFAPKENIYTFVGAASSEAQKKFDDGEHGHFISGTTIPTIHELLQDESGSKRAELEDGLQGLDLEKAGYRNLSALLNQPLTLLSYKTPDALSFPAFILDGRIMTRASQPSQEANVPFISPGTTHYKTVPFIEPTKSTP